jgi:hypothetical protein
MHQLEPETAGEFECGMNGHAQNASRWVETGQNRGGQPLAMDAANMFFPG